MTHRIRLLCAFALTLLASTPLLAFSEEGGAAEAGWAPTIAKLLDVPLPDADGHVLTAILQSSP